MAATLSGDPCRETGPRVRVELMDPIPAVVVARVLDGLRALGLDAELIGASPDAGAWRGSPSERVAPAPEAARRVVLTTHEIARRDEDTAVIALPEERCSTGFDSEFAGEVLEQVVAGLQQLPAGD